jgi:carboxyl-terminal processing protease
MRLHVAAWLALSTGLTASCLAAQPARAAGFDAAWQWEQAERRRARGVWMDTLASPSSVREAIASLESLVTWIRRPATAALGPPNGQPFLRWQESDVLTELAQANARVNQPVKVAAALRDAHRFLRSGAGPIAAGANDESLFSLAADLFTGSPFARIVMGDTAVASAVRALRASDTQRVIQALPFSLKYADTIPLTDRLAGLSYLWSEAKYNFANFDLVPDLDWDAEYRAAIPRVTATARTGDYYRVLQQVIGKLSDGHTDIQLPQDITPQLEIRPRLVPELIDGRVFIRRIGHAEFGRRGFVVGQEIVRIDDVPVVQYGRERIEPYVSSSTPQDRDVRTFSRFLLRGAHGTAARLTIRNADGTEQVIDAPRDTALAWDVVPPLAVRWLPGRIAHVSVNTFADMAALSEFKKHLPELRTATGLILDLRNNGGGNSGIGYSILSHLLRKPSLTSAWSTPQYRPAYRSWRRTQPPLRTAADTIPLDPVRYAGPVALLIGPATFSAAEDFAVAFDVARRGPLIGEATGGSTGNPVPLRLPGGGFARICTKRDTYPDGREFVGVGVRPTIVVPRTIADLRSGGDAALDAAVRALRR